MNWRFKLSKRLALLKDVTVAGAITLAACSTENARYSTGPETDSMSADYSANGRSKVASVSVSPTLATIARSSSILLVATVRDYYGRDLRRTASWSSSNSAVAAVSEAGLVTGLTTGTATISASSGGRVGTATITVIEVESPLPPPPAPAPVASITVTPTTTALDVGASQQLAAVARDAGGNVLTGRVISWSSSNQTVAPVTSGGVVSALVAGSASIVATAEGVSGSAAVSVTSPVAPPPPPSSGTLLASSNFDGGTLTPFTNPWGTGLSVVADPTGSGRGNVARMQYAPGSGSSMERALSYVGSQLRYGQTIWFRGRVYIPSAPAPWNRNHNRKLIDYQGTPGTRMTLHRRDGELRLSVVDWMNGSEQEVIATGTGIQLADNAWHTIEVRMTTNSADNVRDGVLEIYMNGASTPTYRRATGLGWITQRGPTPSYFNTYLIGFQLTIDSGAPSYSEYRYWDDVAFSTGRVGP